MGSLEIPSDNILGKREEVKGDTNNSSKNNSIQNEDDSDEDMIKAKNDETMMFSGDARQSRDLLTFKNLPSRERKATVMFAMYSERDEDEEEVEVRGGTLIFKDKNQSVIEVPADT